jgi:hypothetical protein
MKKYILLILACAMLSTTAYATVTTNYLEDNFETTQEHYSISGASDPQYPLTLNGETVETTESGYFSCYVDLQEGENVFVLDNGSDKKEITITRKAIDAAADSDAASDADEFTEMDAVGVVNRNHPTVRSRPDEAYDDLIGPYVKDTLLHITAKILSITGRQTVRICILIPWIWLRIRLIRPTVFGRSPSAAIPLKYRWTGRRNTNAT